MSSEKFTKQYVNAILKKSVDRVAATVLDKNVDITWDIYPKKGRVGSLTLIFTFHDEFMFLNVSMANYNKRDLHMIINCDYKSTGIYLGRPLSGSGGDEYTKLAQTLGIPAPLDKSEHMTEFCVALIAPLFQEHTLLPYMDSIETMERDGVLYYAGHGGTMRALFLPVFGEGELRIDDDDEDY